MLYKFKNPSSLPPGGWYFITEDGDNVKIEGMSPTDLVREVANYYWTQNMHPPDKLKERIVEQICLRIPTRKWCHEISEGVGDTVLKITRATGIKSVVTRRAKAKGKKAGCSSCGQRQRDWNRALPYNRTVK